MLLFTDCRVVGKGAFHLKWEVWNFNFQVGIFSWNAPSCWISHLESPPTLTLQSMMAAAALIFILLMDKNANFLHASLFCFWIKSCLHVGKMWVQPGRIESTNKEEKIDPAFNAWYFVFLRSHFEQRLKQTTDSFFLWHYFSFWILSELYEFSLDKSGLGIVDKCAWARLCMSLIMRDREHSQLHLPLSLSLCLSQLFNGVGSLPSSTGRPPQRCPLTHPCTHTHILIAQFTCIMLVMQ